MPELPEVETMRRALLPTQGARIARLHAPRTPHRPITIRPGLTRLRTALRDRTLVALERLGKRVILRLDDDRRLVVEPRMTGLLTLDDPPDTSHLRLTIHLHQAPPIHFWDRRGLGTISLLDPHQFDTQLVQRLGPDALDITAHQLRRALATTARPIKSTLLDQSVLAGVGNIYACEALHRARIHPDTPARSLPPAHTTRLARALRHILAQAVRYEGSDLGDGTYRAALAGGASYQNHHRVYGRQDQPCPDCGTMVLRYVQAQRATFFCPSCQAEDP